MGGALWVLIAVRFILGLGEAVAYPSTNQFIAAWFPTHERGKANGWVFGGVGFGSGTAPPLVAFIVCNYGWHEVFYFSAAIGLVVAVIWYYVARDRPSEHPSVTEAEKGAYRRRTAGQDRRPDRQGAVAAYLHQHRRDGHGAGLCCLLLCRLHFPHLVLHLSEGRARSGPQKQRAVRYLALHRHDRVLPLGRRDQRLAGQALRSVCGTQPVRRLHPVSGGDLFDHRQPGAGFHCRSAGAGGRCGRALSRPGDLLGGSRRFRRTVHRRGLGL